MKTATINLAPEIEELCKNLHEQDNLGTNLPQYIVQTKERLYHYDDGSGDYVWVDNDFNEADKEKESELDDQDDFCLSEENCKEGWHKTYYKDIWHNKQPFFTRIAAQRYIDCNGHNLGGRENCRIYVESGYRNDEWLMLREFFVKLDITNS